MITKPTFVTGIFNRFIKALKLTIKALAFITFNGFKLITLNIHPRLFVHIV